MLIPSLIAAIVLLGLAPPAAASLMQPIQPWDGSNPFNCELQQLGQTVDYPDPGADPLCVEFDKTQQNVAPDLGLVDFLSKEPARVAAAVPKCFYYQHDHWTGSIVQGEDPELWNWDGSYFFDRAYARGGVHVENFRIGGVPFDATPYAPPEYLPYLEESGGGGVWLALDIPADPACVAMVDTPEEAARVYRSAPVERKCADAGGNVGKRRIGALRLGASRDGLRKRFGSPSRSRGAADRWCALGTGAIGAVFAKRAAALVVSSSPGHSIAGIGPKSRASRAHHRLDLKRWLKVSGTRVFEVERGGAAAYLGIRKGKVRWLALRSAKRFRSAKAMRRALTDYLNALPPPRPLPGT